MQKNLEYKQSMRYAFKYSSEFLGYALRHNSRSNRLTRETPISREDSAIPLPPEPIPIMRDQLQAKYEVSS